RRRGTDRSRAGAAARPLGRQLRRRRRGADAARPRQPARDPGDGLRPRDSAEGDVMSVETFRTRTRTAAPLDAPDGTRVDERPLLARLQAGDEEACERLVRDHTSRLLAIARRYLRQEEDARDAVQEAFVAAFRSISRFQGTSSLSTWLHRIVINCCLMKLRSGRRRPETSIEELLPRFDEGGHRIL